MRSKAFYERRCVSFFSRCKIALIRSIKCKIEEVKKRKHKQICISIAAKWSNGLESHRSADDVCGVRTIHNDRHNGKQKQKSQLVFISLFSFPLHCISIRIALLHSVIGDAVASAEIAFRLAAKNEKTQVEQMCARTRNRFICFYLTVTDAKRVHLIKSFHSDLPDQSHQIENRLRNICRESINRVLLVTFTIQFIQSKILSSTMSSTDELAFHFILLSMRLAPTHFAAFHRFSEQSGCFFAAICNQMRYLTWVWIGFQSN